MKKILILAANPRKDLNLDREIRDLKKIIESSQDAENFQVVHEPAVRVGDLQDLLLKHRPNIVHFCGHGGGELGLMFDSDIGREQQVGTEALSDLFRLFTDTIECVLLNACYSEVQANSIVNHINYVIGMNQAIRDDAAIAFSKGFYRALGYSCGIEKAFEFGCNSIHLEISGSSVVRSSDLEHNQNVANLLVSTAIPEHLKPTLKKKYNLIDSVETSEISQEIRNKDHLNSKTCIDNKRYSYPTDQADLNFKSNVFYRIRSKITGKVIAISNRSIYHGSDLIQWDWIDSEEQKFQFFRTEGEQEYSLRVKHSRQCIAITAGSRDLGASLIQWECNGYDEQKFSFIPVDRYYAIKAKHSGMLITVNRNEEKIRQYPQESGQFSDDQLFEIDEI